MRHPHCVVCKANAVEHLFANAPAICAAFRNLDPIERRLLETAVTVKMYMRAPCSTTSAKAGQIDLNRLLLSGSLPSVRPQPKSGCRLDGLARRLVASFVNRVFRYLDRIVRSGVWVNVDFT